MSKTTFRKMLRRFGGVDEKNKYFPAGKVAAGKKQKVPIVVMGTHLMVSVNEGQIINPKKELLRQMGVNRKRLKKLKSKAKKSQATEKLQALNSNHD